MRALWARVWRGQPPQGWLLLVASLTALLMSAPVAYVAVRALAEDRERWDVLFDERIAVLLWNTLSLAGVVGLISGFLGVSLAWLVNRTDLPARGALRWLIALPLAIPPYVGAMTYVIVFGPRGWMARWLGETPLDMYSFFGAAFVLSVFTYPYVYLVVGSAIGRLGQVHEDVARSLGLGRFAVLRRVTLPMLRPAVGAGVVLVVLYVLSDFGAVALLRFPTLTSAIYYQMGGFDTGAAALLSLVLIVLTLVVLSAEAGTRRRARFYESSGVTRTPRRVELRAWRWLALIYTGLVLSLSAVVPLAVLSYWTIQAVFFTGLDSGFLEYMVNTLQAAGLAAGVAMVLAVPVVYLQSRHTSPPSRAIYQLAHAGYALPGVIVGLGLIFFSLRLAPAIYGTMVIVAIAYVIRFLPQAMQSTAASIAMVSPRIDEAARIAGLGPMATMVRVVLKLIMPGVLAGAALVFVSGAKELPATLLLRPAGFDTLAVRVWVEASEGAYDLAAPPAMLLVLLSLIPLKLMLDRFRGES